MCVYPGLKIPALTPGLVYRLQNSGGSGDQSLYSPPTLLLLFLFIFLLPSSPFISNLLLLLSSNPTPPLPLYLPTTFSSFSPPTLLLLFLFIFLLPSPPFLSNLLLLLSYSPTSSPPLYLTFSIFLLLLLTYSFSSSSSISFFNLLLDPVNLPIICSSFTQPSPHSPSILGTLQPSPEAQHLISSSLF